ncbi:MAG: trypsin-like peptidase domain-containing protein [Armatimonadetes bacterium]|nr:trypsin-like peptidase domain-containing protein [Armatimonadota bacterium]
MNKKLIMALVGLGAALGFGLAKWSALPPLSSVFAQDARTINFSPEEKATLSSMESALTRVADAVLPSVVHLRVEKRTGRAPTIEDDGGNSEIPQEFQRFFRNVPQIVEGQGSGVIIRSDGYILTNDHVVSGADSVRVIFHDGSSTTGKVLRDPTGDLAIVKVERKGLPAASLGDSGTVKPGQFVFAIGSPFGISQSFTMGIVSGIGREQMIGDSGGSARLYPNLIQTDAAINQGNSGGPLVNSRGEVVGINTAIVGNRFGGSVGVGFAIPINMAKFSTAQLIEKGKVERGYLGITPEDVTPDDEDTYGVPRGALVRSVQNGSPGAKAGLQPGDVVAEINGKPIRGEGDLRETIAMLAPESKAALKVFRDKKPTMLTVTLGARPEDPALSNRGRADAERPTSTTSNLGISVAPVNAEARSKLEMSDSDPGVVVRSVSQNSEASRAGLMPGDVIRSVNGRTVRTPEEFKAETDKIRSGSQVRLVCVRAMGDGAVMQVLLSFPAP